MKYYLDSSVLVEYVVGEPKITKIINELVGDFYTSRLGRTETIRTITRFYSASIAEAMEFLQTMRLIELDREVLEIVESYGSEITLKTSDAIHIASAELLLDIDDYLVTLDNQMTLNAKRLGLQVLTSS